MKNRKVKPEHKKGLVEKLPSQVQVQNFPRQWVHEKYPNSLEVNPDLFHTKESQPENA